jgi:hypothetical protein
MRGWFDWGDHSSAQQHNWFQSDHCFDQIMTSPVTEPFYFEDPRALTEVRPIAIFQSAPSHNPFFRGGNSEFFGLQARLAFTECWSFVVNELGIISLNPNDPTPEFGRSTGFAEVKMGPKWTFYRNTTAGAVAAAGLTFEIPAGDRSVFQNTGDLGLNPYVTYAQNFGRSLNIGSFNFIGTAGYAFATDSQRSEFLHTHFHLDYNVLNMHNWFPLVEMNYWYYTKNGKATDLGFEGADLVNFGSHSTQGRNYLTIALGTRYNFTDNVIGGFAVEWPVSNEKGLADFRLTFDMIFRY